MGMPNEEKLVETFSKLRPACVRITEEQTVENMKALHEALDESDPSAVNELQEYVLFPLRVLLKQPRESKSEDVFLETVSCISKVIDCADQLSEFSLFLDLFSSLCCLLSTRDANICVAPLCEELKLAAVECLAKLTRKLPVNFLARVYTPSFLPCLGHAVTVLLFLAQHESLRTLRCEAMTCLTDLMLVNRDAPKDLKVMCGSTFASFLPGIATALYKVITGDTKQGHRVTCAAITGFTSAVVLVLSDDYLADSALDSSEHARVTDECQNLSVERSSDWIKATSEKLEVVIARIAAVANHVHWRVRLAMIGFADELLTHCSNSLSRVVIQLLNILVQGSLDEFPEVSAPGSAALATFQRRQVECGNQSVVEFLEENLFNLATQLPRKIMDPSDANKLNALKLFSSYLALLGTRVDAVLSSNVHLKRLSLALMQILEFETASLLIIEDQNSEMSLSYDCNPSHQYQFKHFAALEVKEEVVKICHVLGEQGNFLILVDHFMDLFRQSKHYRKQATFCISEILMGAKTRLFLRYSESEVEMLIRLLLDELLQPEVWNLPLANVSKAEGGSLDSRHVRRLESPGHVHSFNELNDNVLQTCLLIDCVGCCASASGSHFDVHLIEVLYPVLEKAGSGNVHVSCRAVACALRVAEACACGNVAGLIRSGMDYLLNSVVLRWRHLYGNPQVLDVLRVMFEFSDADVLPLLSNTIHQMCDVLDLHYEEFGAQFLKVFRAMVCSISKCYGPPSPPNQDIPPDIGSKSLGSYRRNHPKTADDVFRFFEDYRRQKQVLEDMDKNYEQSEAQESDKIDLEERENCGSSDSNDVKKEELPFYVELLKLVLERCRHFLIRPESQIRILVLEIVGQSCLILVSHQDVLLPLVHKIWTPFVQRFSDSDQIVMMKAFDTLRLMSFAAQDFLRRRVISDVLPRVVSVLGRMSDSSMKAGPAYKHSMPCKLQLCILNHLGYFCHCADVKGQHLTLLLHACLPYLSARQPLCLQQACVATFKRFVEIDPDGVWLLLNDVWCPSAFEPPSESLPLIVMAGTSERNEFTDNVSELMRLV